MLTRSGPLLEVFLEGEEGFLELAELGGIALGSIGMVLKGQASIDLFKDPGTGEEVEREALSEKGESLLLRGRQVLGGR